MSRPGSTSSTSRSLRSALARSVPAAVLVAVLAGCTSTPAAPGQSSSGSTAAATVSAIGSTSGSVGSSAAGPSTTDRTSAPGGSRTSVVDGSASGTGSPAGTPGSAVTPTPPSSYAGGSTTGTTAPSTSLSPAATTKVPAPGGGNISQTVPSVAETTAPSRQLTQTAEFGGKVTAQIVALKAITGVANGPGEIAGPALSVTLRVTNGSAKAIDLVGVGVTLTDSAGGPTSTLAGPPSAPFTGTLAAGKDATGTYVFTIAADKRRPITLSLSYSTEAPTVVFAGNAP